MANAQLKNFHQNMRFSAGKKLFLTPRRTVTKQLFVDCLNVFAFHIPLVWSKASAKPAGDMHEFMDEGSFFILRGHLVKNLGDNLNGVGWRQVQYALPDFAQPVDAGDGPTRLAASASDTEHKLGHHMIKLAFLR